MEGRWAILGRVLRAPKPVLAAGDAPPGGEGEAAEAEAHGVAEVEAADAQAGAHGAAEVAAAGAQEGAADFSILLEETPRITVMTAAATAHPDPENPDTHPYTLCVDSGAVLLNSGVGPFMGACFDDAPYQSNLMVVRKYNYAGVEQGHPITATAERIRPRDGAQAIVSNVESIGLIYRSDLNDYFIGELMITKGMERAMLVYFIDEGLHSKWHEAFTENPLPWREERDREWVPSGVVSFNEMFWWFDLSWGIISYDPMLKTKKAKPKLFFHRLPDGQDLTNKAQRLHDRRCIAVSRGFLRFVSIDITPDADDAATVSMWTLIASVNDNDEIDGWIWDKEFTVRFAEIWDHDSYTVTRLPRKVPVLAAVCPSNANILYFALEDPKRLFGVNMYSRRVEEFIDESFELLAPPWLEALPSCRYVLPWVLPPPKVAQAPGEDPLPGEDAEDEEDEEELQEEESEDEEDEEELQEEESEDVEEQSEPEVQSVEELPETKDSELPVDESSDEGTLSVAMDPATVARLRSELEEDRKNREQQGPGGDAGEGAF